MTDARTLTFDLSGKWLASYGTAPCPVCQPERRRDQDALTLSDAPDGRLLAHCKKAGCSFRDLAAALGLTSGTFTKPDPMESAKREAARRAEAAKKAAQAGAVWREAVPICNTLAEAYLRGRGITCALPESLRFHPACWHASGHRLPAILAAIRAGCLTPGAIATATRLGATVAYQALDRMAEAGLIQRAANGAYALATLEDQTRRMNPSHPLSN